MICCGRCGRPWAERDREEGQWTRGKTHPLCSCPTIYRQFGTR